MSTGYTREQIHQLEILLDQNVPPEQSIEHLDTAPIATDVVMAGTAIGALFKIGFEHGETKEFFLNCLVALELVIGLHGATIEESWWGVTEQPGAFEPELSPPKENDLDNALRVLSLRTDSTPYGALICFSTGRTVTQFFMPKAIAHYVLAGLASASERAGWWNDEMQLIPSDHEKLQ